MNDAYLSIGTNIGDRLKNLQNAVTMLAVNKAITVVTVSATYETAAVGLTDQADFLNIAVHVQTSLAPLELLAACQNIENELGRVRTVRWGPRIIDLDILLYNEENMTTTILTLPHPRMYERAFVLLPLLDVIATTSEQLTKALQVASHINAEEEGIRYTEQQRAVESWIQ